LQTLRHVAQLFARDADPHGKRIVRLHDVDEIVLQAETPLPFQVDGEPLSERTAVTLTAVPQALRVIG
jgi:diacylglycerol kinase family enzyme